ncbi:MAG: hypothetical protein KIT84_11990 [Labilithrix sp.]|nr:hypothetical protein [Labilithrix sp.]MCW5811732.1 hypothetical protein [Labilithrix sp.]
MGDRATPDFVPYDELLRAEETREQNHEWVDGVVYAMGGSSPEHSRLMSRFNGRVLTPLTESSSTSSSRRTSGGSRCERTTANVYGPLALSRGASA